MSKWDFNTELIDHYEWLKRNALRYTQNDESIKDLVQDTMMKAFEQQDRYTEGTNFKGFIAVIMRNRFIDLTRKPYYRKTVRMSKELYTKFDNYKPDDVLNRKDIVDVLNGLDRKKVEPYLLKIQGYKNPELAKLYNVNENNIKIIVFRAKKIIQEAVTEYR